MFDVAKVNLLCQAVIYNKINFCIFHGILTVGSSSPRCPSLHHSFVSNLCKIISPILVFGDKFIVFSFFWSWKMLLSWKFDMAIIIYHLMVFTTMYISIFCLLFFFAHICSNANFNLHTNNKEPHVQEVVLQVMQNAYWSTCNDKPQQELVFWQARGLMPKTLEMLAQKGQFHLSSELQAKLASRGFTDIISRSANGKRELPNCQNIYLSLIHSLEFFGIHAFRNSFKSIWKSANFQP